MCHNLKNLTLERCYVSECGDSGGFTPCSSDGFTIINSRLLSLMLKKVDWCAGFVLVDTPELKNFIFVDTPPGKYYNGGATNELLGGLTISARDLTYLHIKGFHFPKLSLDGIQSVEKVDLRISSPQKTNVHRIRDLFQHLHSVKSLALSLEIAELLSTSEEVVSHQPSPFPSLKSLKIYPLQGLKITWPSSNATFTMVSHEEARATKITKAAHRLMADLWKILEEKEAYTETKRANVERKKTLADSCREDFKMKISLGIGTEEIFCILQNIKLLLTKLLKDWCYVDRTRTVEYLQERGSKGFPLISMSSSHDMVANPQFLSTNVTHSIDLLYKYYNSDKGEHVPLKYKLQEETKYWTSCVAQRRGEWLVTELYQFTSYQKEHDFKFEIVGRLHTDHFHVHGDDKKCDLFLVGIEFLPVEHEKDENKVEMQPDMDLDNDWEKILPSDYAEIIKWSKYNLQWSTYKELYSLLHEGFLIKTDVEKWFSVSKNMKKRHMLPAVVVLQKGSIWNFFLGMKHWIWKSLPESRFKLVAECDKVKSFTIQCEIESQLLSLETTYACYLVYKLPRNDSMVDGLVQIDDENRVDDEQPSDKLQLVDLLTPTDIPVIRRQDGESCDIPLRPRKIKGHPKLRKDGWLEIQIWDFRTGASHESISMNCRVKSYDKWTFTGLLVQGIEFRPAKVFFVRP
ncbi:phloem protein 2-like protein [Artemisia annua]|uniref:Phloem protein 2-like protein n=1 Tax=Artemisia annua TaxID=35608 RepID=A0A2U1MND3_ARTAN|nr:phloem protein 2-like protein [Artemisia annua]